MTETLATVGRSLALLVLASCTTTPTPAPQAATHEPLAPLPPEALAPSLALTPVLKAEISLQRSALQHAATDSAALCEAVERSATLSDALGMHISEHGTGDYDVLGRHTDALAEALPGVVLGWGSEGLYTGAEWPVLIQAAGPDSPTGALLEAHYSLVGDFHHVNWLDWSWDLGGCTNLATAATALAEVEAAWTSAPACLQAALRDELEGNLDSIGAHTCYCVDEATARQQLAALAPTLAALSELGGESTAAEITTAMDSETAVYDDMVCGG